MSTEAIKKTAVKKTAVKKATTAVAPKKTTAVRKVSTVKEDSSSGRASAGSKYVHATGRRKTSVANVRIYDADGVMTINGKPAEEYFKAPFLLDVARKPFALTGRGGTLRVDVNVQGGGPNSQTVAVRHGISRALLLLDEALRLVLKKNGMLTRDSREKERKKFGLHRARRAPQWAKR